MIVDYAIGALLSTTVIYVALRYRDYLTRVTTRGRRAARVRLPASLRWLVPGFFTSDRYVAVEGLLILVLFCVVAVSLWAGVVYELARRVGSQH